MKTLWFGDYTDFVCAVSDTYDDVKYKEDLNDVSVIAKYEEMKEIIRELICVGYDISTILFDNPEFYGYEEEYICTIIYGELWVEPFKRGDEYITDESCVTYVLDNCSSRVIPKIKSNLIYEVEIGNDECGDCDGCEESCCVHDNNSLSTTSYMVNGKNCTKTEYEDKLKELNEKFAEFDRIYDNQRKIIDGLTNDMFALRKFLG